MRKCVKCKIQKHRISQLFVSKEPGESDSVQRRRACLFATFTFLQTFTFSPHCWFQNEDELNADERCEKVRQTDWLHWLQQKWSWLSKKIFKRTFLLWKILNWKRSTLRYLVWTDWENLVTTFPELDVAGLGEIAFAAMRREWENKSKKTVTMRTIQILYIV